MMWVLVVVFFKQKTAYEMRISDWSSDVCSSDLRGAPGQPRDRIGDAVAERDSFVGGQADQALAGLDRIVERRGVGIERRVGGGSGRSPLHRSGSAQAPDIVRISVRPALEGRGARHQHIGACVDRERRSEEHTSELQSLMRISYAVFCLKKKKHK